MIRASRQASPCLLNSHLFALILNNRRRRAAIVNHPFVKILRPGFTISLAATKEMLYRSSVYSSFLDTLATIDNIPRERFTSVINSIFAGVVFPYPCANIKKVCVRSNNIHSTQ